MLDLTKLINNRSLLNEDTLEDLRRLVDANPFYQPARLLLVLNLYTLGDSRFEEEMKKASILIPDRKTLFWLTVGGEYDIEKTAEVSSKPEIFTEDDDRTISLIDSYLMSQEDEDNPSQEIKPHSTPTVAEVTSDYASFLQMQDYELPAGEKNAPHTGKGDENVPLKGASLIDNFIEERKGKQRYEMADSDEDALCLDREALYDPVRDLEASERDEDFDFAVYNENFVNILIKQGKYEQGLAILKKICLNNPEKNANFANQIRLLEVIINQQNASTARPS